MLTPTSTKTEHRERAETQVLAVAGDGPPGHCGVQRLYGWHKWLLAHGYHCKGPVFANLNGRGNRSEALQSTALQMSVQRALTRHDLYRGETVHSFRRGSAQNMEDEGADLLDVCRRLGIKTAHIGSRYLDRGRHPA